MTTTGAELKEFCRERLAPYKVPGKYEFVTELPKTQIGKVLRRVLRQKAAQSEETVEALAVGGAT
jgi:long-chain acyl-CoA synthetase